MNEKVENLIKQEKELLEISKKQMRDNHLKSLRVRAYQGISADYDSSDPIFDPKIRKFYSEKSIAFDEVTDAEYEEICKYFPPTPSKKKISKTGAEKTLSIIAVIVLIFCIIGFLISLITLQFVTSIWFLLTSLTIWSILRIFCEIAINIRQINNKIK